MELRPFGGCPRKDTSKSSKQPCFLMVTSWRDYEDILGICRGQYMTILNLLWPFLDRFLGQFWMCFGISMFKMFIQCCSSLFHFNRHVFAVKMQNSTLRVQVGFQFHTISILFHPSSHFPPKFCLDPPQAAKANEEAIRTEATGLFRPSPEYAMDWLKGKSTGKTMVFPVKYRGFLQSFPQTISNHSNE